MKYYKDKFGWEHHVGARFPNMTFWGILTIIAMIAKASDLTQIASTFFIILGIFYLYKSKRTEVKPCQNKKRK